MTEKEREKTAEEQARKHPKSIFGLGPRLAIFFCLLTSRREELFDKVKVDSYDVDFAADEDKLLAHFHISSPGQDSTRVLITCVLNQ